MSVEEDHVHVWFLIEGNFFCKVAEWATIMSGEDVAARLNRWIDLETEAWNRRILGGKERLRAHDEEQHKGGS